MDFSLFQTVKKFFREEDLTKVNIEDLDLEELGYTSVMDFRTSFYPFSCDKIYQTTSPISPYIYVDYDKFLQVELYNLSKTALDNFVKPEDRFAHSFDCIAKGKYLRLYMCMCSNMLALDFVHNYKKIPKEQLLDVFKYVYQNQDFNFDIFTREVLEYIKENNQSTSDKLIKIYRGEGEKSLPLEKAYSWTTNLNMAAFFASRFDACGKIYQGYIKESDAIYIEEDGEKEILCFFEDIIDIEEI